MANCWCLAEVIKKYFYLHTSVIHQWRTMNCKDPLWLLLLPKKILANAIKKLFISELFLFQETIGSITYLSEHLSHEKLYNSGL